MGAIVNLQCRQIKKPSAGGWLQSLQSCGLVKSSFFGTEIEVWSFRWIWIYSFL